MTTSPKNPSVSLTAIRKSSGWVRDG